MRILSNPIASVYSNVDLGGDVVDRGAFDKALREGRTFPLLWQHNPSLSIGSVQISDSDVGLQVEGKLVLEDPQARIALAHLKARTLKGLSIGYDTIKDSIENGVRHLKELRLWEVSVVTFPMNEATMVTSVKSIDDARRVLREGGFIFGVLCPFGFFSAFGFGITGTSSAPAAFRSSSETKGPAQIVSKRSACFGSSSTRRPSTLITFKRSVCIQEANDPVVYLRAPKVSGDRR